MPARRLPWFKFWPEAMQHPKIALLSDGVFRTWVALLSEGSRQPVRWRFASVKHAASVTGRPVKHVRELLAGRLMDEATDGAIWVHDWRQWQERYESDFAPRTLREDSANAPRTLPPELRREKREEDTETEEDVTTPQPPPQAEGEFPPTPRKRGARNGRGRGDNGRAVVTTPASDEDRLLWDAARDRVRPDMLYANWEQLVAPLCPLGRASDGALQLRAPPGAAMQCQRARHYIARALIDLGDEAGARVAIVE